MSGHSKWATIKHQKGAKDAKRGAAFTKFANLIAVAARYGADPDTNFRLRLAVNQAKLASVPAANIERAIKRGSGQLEGSQMEEVLYEGYAPGGVAVLVETATDNRNRTSADVRSAFTKHGGNLGTPGSVAYQFNQLGIIVIPAPEVDTATLAAIEAGATDVDELSEPGKLTVYTAPSHLDAVRTELTKANYEVESAELSYIPKSIIAVEDLKTAQTILKLMDALEELDDVTVTHSNFDIPDDVASQL